jgi:hypothetical protein
MFETGTCVFLGLLQCFRRRGRTSTILLVAAAAAGRIIAEGGICSFQSFAGRVLVQQVRSGFGKKGFEAIAPTGHVLPTSNRSNGRGVAAFAARVTAAADARGVAAIRCCCRCGPPVGFFQQLSRSRETCCWRSRRHHHDGSSVIVVVRCARSCLGVAVVHYPYYF